MAQIIQQTQIVTNGVLCNAASRSTLHYAEQHDYEGHVKGKYPGCIANDKCGEFVHESECIGSVAGVAYRIGDCKPGAPEWVVAWSNHPSSQDCPRPENKVYTTIVKCGSCWDWDEIKKELDKSGPSSSCEWGGYIANVTISQCTSASLEATITRRC